MIWKQAHIILCYWLLLIPTPIDTIIGSVVRHLLSMIQASLEAWLCARSLPPAQEYINSDMFEPALELLTEILQNLAVWNNTVSTPGSPPSQQSILKKAEMCVCCHEWIGISCSNVLKSEKSIRCISYWRCHTPYKHLINTWLLFFHVNPYY